MTFTKLLAGAAFTVLVSTGALAAEATSIGVPSLPLGTVTFPNGKAMTLTVGFGSGAFHRAGDPATTIYTITDRGPNIDCGDAADLIGMDNNALCAGSDAAKIFPIPDFTPAIYELSFADGSAKVVRAIPLKGTKGNLLNGLSASIATTTMEGAYDPDGEEIAKSPDGFDSEGLVRLSDGTFWIGEEYGGSIAHVAADGTVIKRLVPAGLEGDFAGASYPVEGKLPAIIMKRYLNRGIESMAVSPDEKFLYFAIQSPLANPDKKAYQGGTIVRIFKFDLGSQSVVGEYAYPLDAPDTFVADNAKGPRKQTDVKVSEMTAVGPDQLLVLERISKTTKFYRVDLAGATTVPAAFDDMATGPSLEQTIDLAAAGVVPLAKTLALDTDDLAGAPEKIEGVAMIGPNELVVTSDSDFGIEGANSTITRIMLDAPLTN